MDKIYNRQTWVGNMFQKFEAVCHEVDEFVNKDTLKYVENHMQTVGESVKKFYSGVVQEFLPPLEEPVQNVAEVIPLIPINLVETSSSSVVGINEDTIDRNTNISEETTLVPTEKCQELSITGLCHSEQISSKISGYPVGDADSISYVQNEGHNLINKNLGKAIQVHPNCSTSSQGNFVVEQSSCKDVSFPEYKNSSEAVIYSGCVDEDCDDNPHESSKNHCDNISSKDDPEGSVFEDADWGIEDIIDLDLVIDGVTEGAPSPFPSEDVSISAHGVLFSVPFVEENSEKVPMETLVSGFEISHHQEKETLLNNSIDEFKSDLNTSSVHQSSKLESSMTCNENKEERKSCDSSSLTFKSSLADPDIIYSDSTEQVHCFSASSHNLSSCESHEVIVHDNNNDSTRPASSSGTLYDDTTRTDGAVSATELCGDEHGFYNNLPRFDNSSSCSEIDISRTDGAVSATELCSSEHGCYDNLPRFDTSLSCSEIGTKGGSMVDAEYLNMDTIDLSDKKQHLDTTIDLSNKKQLVESSVIIECQNLSSYPYKSGRSKSYKDIIKDAFMSRKRLTQEYKQLAIWYGDINQDFSQPTEENTLHSIGSTSKSPTQDLPDSEWELV